MGGGGGGAGRARAAGKVGDTTKGRTNGKVGETIPGERKVGETTRGRMGKWAKRPGFSVTWHQNLTKDSNLFLNKSYRNLNFMSDLSLVGPTGVQQFTVGLLLLQRFRVDLL